MNSDPRRNAVPYGFTRETGLLPSYADNRHLCTLGPTRSGKGATVIVQALLTVPHSVVVIDPKGQNAAVTARRRREMGQDVFVLNPFGLHAGAPWHLPRHRYNPLAALDIQSSNVVGDVAALANALIITQGREPYFDDTARDLVSAVILFLVSTLGPKATLGQMRKAITDIAARGKEAAQLLVAMGRSPYPFVAQPIGRFRDAEARDIAAAVNTAITQTAFLDNPAFSDSARGTLAASDFSFAQLKRKPTSIFLILPGHLMESYARFLRLMITSALDAVMAAPGGHPVLMVLDEFARLERLPALSAAFSYSAGYRCQLWPFLQSLGQLEATHGKEAMDILANCGMQQFFTPVDMQTAEYLQRRGGVHTGESRSRNYGGMMWKQERGESRSESRVPLLPVERVMSMPQEQSLVFFAGTHDPLLAPRGPYWEVPRFKGMYDPDPFHMD